MPSEIFEAECPKYLAIGMTYDQYWNGDANLPRYYRKADKIRQERINAEAWLHGLYIYEALCDVAPVMVAFPKKGAKPKPYPTEPHMPQVEEDEQTKIRKSRDHIERMMETWNAKFKAKKGGKTDG